ADAADPGGDRPEVGKLDPVISRKNRGGVRNQSRNIDMVAKNWRTSHSVGDDIGSARARESHRRNLADRCGAVDGGRIGNQCSATAIAGKLQASSEPAELKVLAIGAIADCQHVGNAVITSGKVPGVVVDPLKVDDIRVS